MLKATHRVARIYSKNHNKVILLSRKLTSRRCNGEQYDLIITLQHVVMTAIY